MSSRNLTRSDIINMMGKTKTSQLNVEIPRELHKQVRIHSAKTEMEMREIVIHALLDYLS